MHYSFTTIFRDSINFFKNNLKILLLFILLLALINTVVTYLLMPSADSLAPIYQLYEKTQTNFGNIDMQSVQQVLQRASPQEQQIFISSIGSFFIKITLSYVIVTLIISSTLLSLISQLSNGQAFEPTLLMHKAGRLTWQILLFMLCGALYTLLLLIIATIIPPLTLPIMWLGMLIYGLVYQLYLALSALHNKAPMMNNIKVSFSVLRAYPNAVFLMFLVMILASYFVVWLVSNLIAPGLLFDFISNLLVLSVICFTSIYYYRLVSLTTNQNRIYYDIND